MASVIPSFHIITTMELYEYARPDLMAGKTVLYVHGFASGGLNGTVKTMGVLLPSARIIAPDLPVRPQDAMEMLRSLCEDEKPDLIIGTSMGGMYTELLHGHDRIIVNPAFHLADTILKNNGLGRQEYHCPRRDGQTSFLVNKGLLEDFREVSAGCFASVNADAASMETFGDVSGEAGRVYGLFGTKDTMVDTYDEFASHYPNAIRFDGGHYLDDGVFLHSVLPLMERIDDLQEKRSKPVLLISFADTLADVRNGVSKGLPVREMDPCGSAVRAFVRLCSAYKPYILVSNDFNAPSNLPDIFAWINDHIGVPAWNRVIVANRKDMVLGDYLIDRHPDRLGAGDFMGTVLHFGEDPFRTWDEVLTYFDRLGGQ